MPGFYDTFMALPEHFCLKAWRAQLLAQARGLTLDLGAGTGANLCCMPEGLDLRLVEPQRGMSKHIAARLQQSGRDAQIVQAPAEALPFEDGSVDTVICTLVLCTVQDPARAVAEIRRVLKPDGQLLFMEHVLHQGRVGAAIQRAVEPVWLLTSDGCHLTRDSLRVIEEGGFEVVELAKDAICVSPPPLFPLVRGRATFPAG
ncbi:MAG: methyltransferase domain-containing protein [Deltaproteobacteria bacterium]|nr:methyltransferase domain-containing protein [Deltaproteobacteria bacterium]